mmetsp:Transcript_101497/g.326189  ORF Transcript_101497/g.326189 Transcript_101497/m.326189 type:complete len:289 (+) Transcript_101497:404-1270(+)
MHEGGEQHRSRRSHNLVLLVQLRLERHCIVELVRPSCLERGNPLGQTSEEAENREVERALRHRRNVVQEPRVPEDARRHGAVDARLHGLEHEHSAQEDAQEGHEADALEHTVHKEGPAVDAQRSRLLIVSEVADQQTIQRCKDDEDRHENMYHQQLDPQEEKAPAENHLVLLALDLPQYPREVVVHVDDLAEAQGVPLRLDPSGLNRGYEALALRRVVEDREKDRRDLKPASGREEALQSHVPVLRDPIRVPSLHRLGQGRGDGVRRIGDPHGVRVGQVRQLVLAGHE